MRRIKDWTQHKKKLKTPQIRVWCHPVWINRKNEGYYRVFDTLAKAIPYAEKTKSAENAVCLAVNGYEYLL